MSDNTCSYENFVVAFYDVLNQGNTLMQWDDRDKLDANDPGAIKAFNDSVGDVKKLRDGFQKLFNGYMGKVSDSLSAISAEYKHSYEENLKPTIQRQAFSDTNIWFVHGEDQNGNICVRRINQMFSSFSFMHLNALAKGIPARGAIEFGCGTDGLGMQDGQSSEIYGPVLVKAYKLEDEEAHYPRILIGESLYQFLHDQVKAWETKWEQDKSNQFSTLMKMQTEKAVNFIARDNDGFCILDYAGEKSAEEQKWAMEKISVDFSALYSGALQFSRDSQTKYQSEGDCKLTGRYTMLVDYLESRKQYWQ